MKENLHGDTNKKYRSGGSSSLWPDQLVNLDGKHGLAVLVSEPWCSLLPKRRQKNHPAIQKEEFQSNNSIQRSELAELENVVKIHLGRYGEFSKLLVERAWIPFFVTIDISNFLSIFSFLSVPASGNIFQYFLKKSPPIWTIYARMQFLFT